MVDCCIKIYPKFARGYPLGKKIAEEVRKKEEDGGGSLPSHWWAVGAKGWKSAYLSCVDKRMTADFGDGNAEC